MKLRKILSVLIMTMVCTVMFSACGEQTIDISQYINVTFDGLDGSGTANISRNNLDSAIEKILLGDDEEEWDFAKLNSIDIVEDSIKLTLDNDSELSNGDVVTLKISADEKKVKENGIKLTGMNDITFAVSGLKEITEIDPFDPQYFNVESGEGVYIEFTGISPNADIQIRNTLPDSNPLSKVSYVVDKSYSYNIKKGQTITITAYPDESFEEDGIILTEESAEVTCEKVDEYIKSVSDIDDETMQKIVKQCNDLYTSKFETYSNEYDLAFKDSEGNNIYRGYMDSITDMKYEKEYFCVHKDGLKDDYSWFLDENMEHNGLFITAKVNLNKVKLSYFEKTTKDYKDTIISFRIYDIVKNKDGEVQFTSDMVKYGNYIYVDENSFKTAEINPYLDSFEITDEKAADFKQ